MHPSRFFSNQKSTPTYPSLRRGLSNYVPLTRPHFLPCFALRFPDTQLHVSRFLFTVFAIGGSAVIPLAVPRARVSRACPPSVSGSPTSPPTAAAPLPLACRPPRLSHQRTTRHQVLLRAYDYSSHPAASSPASMASRPAPDTEAAAAPSGVRVALLACVSRDHADCLRN